MVPIHTSHGIAIILANIMLSVMYVWHIFVLFKNGSLQESFSFLEEENNCVKSKVTETVEDDVVWFDLLWNIAWYLVWRMDSYITESSQVSQSDTRVWNNTITYIHTYDILVKSCRMLFVSKCWNFVFVFTCWDKMVEIYPYSLTIHVWASICTSQHGFTSQWHSLYTG